MAESYYDDARVSQTRKIDPCETLPDIITDYVYDKARSNALDKPYKVGRPYYDGNTPVYTDYFHYDKNGNQDATWYYWDEPNTAPGHDKRVLTISDYDAQGRVIRTRRIIDDNIYPDYPNLTAYLEGDDGVILSQTEYNSIGKADYTIDGYGVVTVYEYDELGGLVESVTYADWTHYNGGQDPCSLSRTLYDDEGRVLVSAGPYDPTDAVLPTGTETVYDALGRVIETRRWADIQINLTDLIVNSKIVGKTATGWTHGDLLSRSRTEYDTAGNTWKTYQQDETSIEHCINEYIYDMAGKQSIVKTLPDTNDPAVTQTHYKGTRRDWVKDARDNTTEFEYDTLGRVVKITYPATAENPVTYKHFAYDGLGRKIFESR